ncbi:phosphoglycerate mutase family protein [Helicobacter typhlonius]|uniref:phosphoglycerate mutase family protein n=1 Tax=Helicobacter typhlonius TaxID=76936 RepID=UPI002FE2437F
MDFLELAKENQQKAFEVIGQTKVLECWQSIGAEINLIGSLKMGLLCKHLDIDFHIYTPTLEVTRSFDAMAKLANNPKIIHIEYRNLLEEEDKCLEWHAFYQDEQLWQIDMIHIVQGSKYAGYFERMAERILQIMSEAQKEQILKLKFETPDNLKIAGIEYYQAVLQEGITDFTEFMQWHKSRPQNAIVEWIP